LFAVAETDSGELKNASHIVYANGAINGYFIDEMPRTKWVIVQPDHSGDNDNPKSIESE